MSFFHYRNERRWLSENDASLLEDLQNNISIEELALKYNKSSSVVRSRVLHMALIMINDVGFGIKTTSKITTIPEEDLEVYLNLMERKRNNLVSKL